MLDVLLRTLEFNLVVDRKSPIPANPKPGFGPNERAGGREPIYVPERGCCWVLVEVKEQEIADGLLIQLIRDVGLIANAVERVADQQDVGHPGVVKRFYPEVVAGAEEVATVLVPDGEREVAEQVVDAGLAP